jgi:hypothetical protein
MQFNLEGLKDLKTTIIGVIVIAGATYAMSKGLCSFDRWWEIIGVVILLVGSTGALFVNPKSKE